MIYYEGQRNPACEVYYHQEVGLFDSLSHAASSVIELLLGQTPSKFYEIRIYYYYCYVINN